MSTQNFSQVVCAKCDKPADHMLLCSNPECVGYRQQVSMPKWAWDELTSLKTQLARALEDAERAKGELAKYAIERNKVIDDACLAFATDLNTLAAERGALLAALEPFAKEAAAILSTEIAEDFTVEDAERDHPTSGKHGIFVNTMQAISARDAFYRPAARADASRPGASGGGTAG